MVLDENSHAVAMNTMNRQFQVERVSIRPMSAKDIAAIMSIENRAYEFPWSEAIFRDCLCVGYCCWVLEQDGVLAGYGIMSVAVGESHILNLCIDPAYHSIGLGKRLLHYLLTTAWEHDANRVFLEVRPSNFIAIRLYLGCGFDEIGIRKNYYPAKLGREDALVLARTSLKTGYSL